MRRGFFEFLSVLSIDLVSDMLLLGSKYTENIN